MELSVIRGKLLRSNTDMNPNLDHIDARKIAQHLGDAPEVSAAVALRLQKARQAALTRFVPAQQVELVSLGGLALNGNARILPRVGVAVLVTAAIAYLVATQGAPASDFNAQVDDDDSAYVELLHE